MSKQPQYSEFGDDDLPPPYTPVASQGGGLFDSHVRSLLQSAESTQASTENEILASLINPTDSFLASISGVRPSTKQVEGVFVPAEALGPGWRLTEEGDKSKGELSRIVRVEQQQQRHGKEDSKKEKSSSSSYREEIPSHERGFTEWGRWDDDDASGEDSESMLWWADDDLARRLARQLQPAQPHSEKSSQSGGGGTLRRALSGSKATKEDQGQQRSAITVRAEEVTFRRENEMGIWESRTGWCIVVRVRLQR